METLRTYPGTAKEGETTKAIESYTAQIPSGEGLDANGAGR